MKEGGRVACETPSTKAMRKMISSQMWGDKINSLIPFELIRLVLSICHPPTYQITHVAEQ